MLIQAVYITRHWHLANTTHGARTQVQLLPFSQVRNALGNGAISATSHMYLHHGVTALILVTTHTSVLSPNTLTLTLANGLHGEQRRGQIKLGIQLPNSGCSEY